MSLSFDEPRDKRDVDKIFWYIRSDLFSIHPSNDKHRIFLQYFQPLFDLTLGIAYQINNKIIASHYLPPENENILRTVFNKFVLDQQPLWLPCAYWDTYNSLKQSNFPYIEDSKSCLIFPIPGSNDKSSFILFSRLIKENNKEYDPKLLNDINSQIADCLTKIDNV